MMVATPRPFLADHLRESAVVFDLGGGVRLVSELLLQAHDLNGVAFPVRLDARHEEAGEAFIRVGQRQEGVAHRRGAKIFVAHQPVVAARAARTEREGTRRIGAHVGAALLLGHRHANGQPALLRDGPERRVIDAAHDFWLPRGGYIRLMPQSGHARIGHAHGAHRARLGLG